MSLNATQQFNEIISGSSRTLIAVPESTSIDRVVSALALGAALTKQDKHVTIVAPNFESSNKLSFLQNISHLQTEPTSLRSFCIEVDLSRSPVDTVDYQIQGNTLKIELTPTGNTSWTPEDVRTTRGAWTHDACIVIGSPDLEHLGELFAGNAEFFYQTPLVNIDYHAENENFGQLNMVNIKASSAGELIFDLLSAWNHTLIDEHVATLLLTGIIEQTQSFKFTTTPQTLGTASQLIALGGDRKTIVNNLYQQKSLATLKLWGRALARLRSNNEYKFVYSLIPHTDFEKSGATPANLHGIIDEIIANSPEAGIVAILYENHDKTIHGIAKLLHNHYDLLRALELYQPKGSTNRVTFTLPSGTSLGQAENLIATLIQNHIQEYK